MKSYKILRKKAVTSIIIGLNAFIIALCGNQAQAQSSVSGIYPNGTNLFQPSSTLSFIAASPAGVTNVTVALTVTTLSGSASFIKHLTLTSGLTISGPGTSETVSAALSSNTLYSAVIQVTDANGVVATTNINYFDTISPSYTWEAEDFDNSQMTPNFKDNPQVNQYANLPSSSGVDYNNTSPGSGQAAYRPQGLETENGGSTGDLPRLQYINTTNLDYDVGYNNGGNWGNYTRHYPPGLYNVYVRGSGGNGKQADAGEITNAAGSASFAGTGPFTFSIQGHGWNTWEWDPVLDSSNNLAQLTIASGGATSTLQLIIDKGNCNENFFLLVPADTNPPATSSSLVGLYPDGKVQFQPAAALTFTVDNTNGIDPANISVQLSGTNLLGQGFVTNYTTANGLIVTGTASSRNVSAPLTTNTMYTAFIQITDGSGNTQGFPVTFDTISPSYTFEAEDFDQNSGGFVDNPQTNAYDGASATQGIDDNVAANNVHSFAYRGGPLLGFGLNTEGNGDKPRAAYANTNAIDPITGVPYVDYDVGYNSGGDWGNYTRHFPAGSYNVYLRGSNGGENGGGNVGAGTASMSLLTSGYGTDNQTVTNMGTFTIFATGGWQTYTWVPLKDAFGNLVKFTGGSQETLQVQTLGLASGGSYNANFYMLIPAAVNLPAISDVYPNGTALFQSTNKLSFVATSGAAIATSNIVVTLNGTNATGLSFVAATSGWTVSLPLQANASYTLAITITDNNKQIASFPTTTIDTFQATDYQLEAEDYDYTANGISGLFFDNPQTNAYYDLPSTAGIDNLQSDTGANPFDYRNVDPAGTIGPSPATTPSADLSRAQFVNGKTDYNIGFFGPGSWCNYTRHYPAGTYYVWERYAEGGQPTASTLSKVTAGYGTANQTTSLLGTFTNVVGGWSLWAWAPLTDATGKLVPVTLSGQTTLQLGGSPVAGQSEVNVNFFILAPASTAGGLQVTASHVAGNIVISFPTQIGSNYQVLFKKKITDATWTALGSQVTGTGSVGSVNDPISGSSRFYRVQVN